MRKRNQSPGCSGQHTATGTVMLRPPTLWSGLNFEGLNFEDKTIICSRNVQNEIPQTLSVPSQKRHLDTFLDRFGTCHVIQVRYTPTMYLKVATSDGRNANCNACTLLRHTVPSSQNTTVCISRFSVAKRKLSRTKACSYYPVYIIHVQGTLSSVSCCYSQWPVKIQTPSLIFCEKSACYDTQSSV